MIIAIILAVVCLCSSTLQAPVGQCPTEDGPQPTYLPDSDNCTHFYECNNGYPFLIVCPPDTAFDDTVNVCAYSPGGACIVHAKDTVNQYFKQAFAGQLTEGEGHLAKKCPKEDIDEFPTFLINPKNCSTYYECAHGIPFLVECPPGLEFDSLRLTCDRPEEANCSVSSDPDVVEDEDRLTEGEGHLAKECPKEDVDEFPTFLINPKNCSSYYECAHGTPFLIECPPGQEFDAKRLVCDSHEEANCTVQTDFTLRSLASEEGVLGNSGPELAKTCPAVDSRYPVYLLDETNCHRYFECSNGQAFLHECPPGLQFDSETLACSFPLEAGSC